MTYLTDRHYNALEDCLSDLQKGQDLEDSLDRYPDLASELRPALEAALLAGSLANNFIPDTAFQRSRTSVLGKVVQLQAKNKPRPLLERLPRMAFVALGIALLVFLSWQGLLVASAKALPGDTLYPIKRGTEDLSLRIIPNAVTKRSIEIKFERRRVDEVAKLLALGRVVDVQFEGVLMEKKSEIWTVDGIQVALTPQTRVVGEIETGMVVEVDGRTQPDGLVLAKAIYLHSYQMIGQVESISSRSWVISGLELNIRDDSQIDPAARVDNWVIVLIQVNRNGSMDVLAILRLLQPALLGTAIPTMVAEPDEQPELTEIEFTGIVEAMSANAWQIDGRSVLITIETEIENQIAVGDTVRVHALVGSNSSLTAREISREDVDVLHEEKIDQDDDDEKIEDEDNIGSGGEGVETIHDEDDDDGDENGEDNSDEENEKVENKKKKKDPGGNSGGDGDGDDGGDQENDREDGRDEEDDERSINNPNDRWLNASINLLRGWMA